MNHQICPKTLFLISKNIILSFVLFYFSGAGIFCFTHRLRQLTHDVKSDVRSLNFISDVTHISSRKHRMTFGKGRSATSNMKDESIDK